MTFTENYLYESVMEYDIIELNGMKSELIICTLESSNKVLKDEKK